MTAEQEAGDQIVSIQARRKKSRKRKEWTELRLKKDKGCEEQVKCSSRSLLPKKFQRSTKSLQTRVSDLVRAATQASAKH